MNTAAKTETLPFERKTWFTAVIEVSHKRASRTGFSMQSYFRQHVLGRFATADETVAAIVAYTPKKGVVSNAYVCRCEQTGRFCGNGYGAAEVTGNYDAVFTPAQIAALRAKAA